MSKASVVLCTHNPRMDFLERTLAGLRSQSLEKEEWELILVDNGSKELLSGRLDLSWHPHAQVVREETLGLSHARFRGIRLVKHPLIVFVDDDNVLREDYLQNACSMADERPYLGAFGGSKIADYEAKPEHWARHRLGALVIGTITNDQWCCCPNQWINNATPAGAGLCVRREIALEYLKKSQDSEIGKSLGRKGTDLAAGEDIDLVFCGNDLGYACGCFAQLELTHLISKNRVQADYLLRLEEGNAYSWNLLLSLRNPDHRIEEEHVFLRWAHYLANFAGVFYPIHRLGMLRPSFLLGKWKEALFLNNLKRAHRRGLRKAARYIQSSQT